MIKGCIFDLDGVIVDTAKYHYLAWKKLAHQLQVDFTEHDNEQLKGVSRMASLEYILKLGNITMSDNEKMKYAESKNNWYVEYIANIDQSELLPGAYEALVMLKEKGIKIALGSASKNAVPILKTTGIFEFFDYISDGHSTSKSKPDPEVFLIAAQGLALSPSECIVFEDAISGIEGANTGGFYSIGIGQSAILTTAKFCIPDLAAFSYSMLEAINNEAKSTII